MREIPLSNGAIAMVDDEEYEKVKDIKWHLDANGYAAHCYWDRTSGKRKMARLLMHRLIMGETNMVVDHINGDKQDNRKENLRLVTKQQNSWNQKVSDKRGGENRTSKFKGVQQRSRNSWRARIRYNDQLINLGSFPTEELAALAYNEGAKKYYGEFARLNVI